MQFSLFLETLPEFADFNRSELDTLEHIMRVREYPEGHEFFREGGSPDGMFLVIEGDIAVTHDRRDGHGTVEIHRVHPGELFGLAALIDHGRSSATYRGRGKTRVASLPRAAFNLMYSANSPLAGHFLKMASRQLMRDYRALVRALTQNIFEANEETVSPVLSTLPFHYTGPERRKAVMSSRN